MMTSNVKVHFKGVDPSATEVEFIDFLSRSAGGIKPINVKFFNPKGQIAVYKHGVAEYAKPEQASAVVALFGVLIETCEFKGRKLTSVAFFTDNSNANNSNTESGTNGRAGSHSPRYSNSQGGAGPEPELGPSVQKFKLCVYNIPVNADKGQLKSHLEQMSGVEIVDLFFVPRTGKTQVKNGFVTYANNEHAEKVKALINNGGTCQFMGFTLAANYAFEKNPNNSRTMNSNYDQPQSSNGSMQNRLNFSSASTPPKRPATGTQETSGLPSNGFGNGTRTRPVTSMIRQGGQGRASDTGNSSLTGSTATLVPNGYQNNYNNPRSMRDSNQRSSRPPFVPTSKEFSTTQAMVQGLPISINKQMLIDAFSPYGSLQYAYASAPKPDRSFIIGFIGYDHPESLERMWSETNRRIVINGNEYEVKPAFHKEYEMLEKTLERVGALLKKEDKNQRGAAFAGSQETRSTVSTNQQQQLQQSSSSPRVPSNNQSDLSGYCATSETAAAITVKNQMMLPSHPQPVVAGSSNQQAAPVANATSSLPQSAVSSPIKCLPAPPSSSTSSTNVTKLPTLANMNFIDLCQQSLIPVTPKKYNNYMDIVFEVRDAIVNQDLQKMLNEAGQNAVIGTITYVVPGEIVIAENPNKSPGTFSRFVVRSFNVDTNLAMLEDLDSCEHCEVSVEILRPINDECCALPVAHFHGGLINCEPLPDKVDEVNELVEECIMGEEQSSDAPVFVQVYRQIYNWVDCEASDKDIVEEAFSKIMIEGGVAKAPQTAEEWTRTRAVDPLKLTKGVERECTVVVNESPNDLSMHVNGLVDGDLLCSVWPSIELNPVPNYRPFPMEVVCTLHDDQWLRANVLKVTDSSATLYCIDWGDIIEQPFSKIRPATSQFLHDDQHNTMPGMAIRVSMHGLKYPTKFTEEQIELFKSICKVDDIFNLKIVELNKRRRAYVGDLIKNGENILELCLKNGIIEESSLAEPVTSKVATSPPEQVQDEVENVYEQPPVEAELDSAVSDMASMQLNGETGVVDLNEQVAQMAQMIRRMDEKMNMMMERLHQLENAQN